MNTLQPLRKLPKNPGRCNGFWPKSTSVQWKGKAAMWVGKAITRMESSICLILTLPPLSYHGSLLMVPRGAYNLTTQSYKGPL
jgi:hypothetical protein